MKKVLILMGSQTDMEDMEPAAQVLESLGVKSEIQIASAHRTPEKVSELSKSAAADGFGVIIAGAGFAAHLAGAVAAHTLLPVIGVPLATSPLEGWDALLSTAQMPAGVPVATMGIGKSGARNAAWLAAQILAITDDELMKTLLKKRSEMKDQIDEANRTMKR